MSSVVSASLAAVVAIVLMVALWAVVAQAQPATDPAPMSDRAPMDNQRLDELLREHFDPDSIQSSGGVWRVEIDDEAEPEAEDGGEVQGELGPGGGDRLPPVLLVVTDQRANRMRIMMPIRPFDPDREEDLQLAIIALHANYDRALDARYAVHDGMLWSAFIHPLSSLTEDDLANALRQVRGLRDNTGTTYSSGELFFGVPRREPEARPRDDTLPDDDGLAI